MHYPMEDEKLVAQWGNMETNLQLWILQLHQHIDSAIPDKYYIMISIIDFQYGVTERYSNVIQ